MPTGIKLGRATALLLLLSLVPNSQVPYAAYSLPRPQVRPHSQYRINNSELDALQNFFRDTTTANEKRFRGKLGEIKGFGAGTTYPQIWLRDSATAIPVTRYHYPLEYMTSWIEEHLAHQKRDGSLYDWIAPGKKSAFLDGAPRTNEVFRGGGSSVDLTVSADKNTTEADQETSAVDSAYSVFSMTGETKWLAKQIGGESIIRRLDRSLMYLLTARFDARHGLITNALTADWGDVSPVYTDQRAIYMDDRTPVVVGLYTNVLFYRASTQLSEMCRALGQVRRSVYWQQQAATVKRNINRFMWQEAKGFYRIHIQLAGDAQQLVDISNLFAMGGNGLAVLYGVANDSQAARIFDVAFRRQSELGFSTIAGVLLPSFPNGFFRHPAVNREYNYQNGGQWDWFAGRFLLAEFERGDARRALTQLSAIAAKAKSNGGLFEWHTRDGKGMGSPNYLGSAGALAAALFQGLFGVYSTAHTLDLKIRLAEQSAQVSLYEPATKRMIFYDYKYLPGEAKLLLNYQSNFRGLGRICILLPENAGLHKLLKNGKPGKFTTEPIGEDRYACVVSNWANQRLELHVPAAPKSGIAR